MNAVTILLFLTFYLAINNWNECLGDGASEQLRDCKNSEKNFPIPTLTTGFGAPVDSITASLTVGKYGPLVVDNVFLERVGKLTRERIPERAVHSKGHGAFGWFTTTQKLTNYSKSIIFQDVGRQFKVAVRFSLSVSDRGAPDTTRDIGGMAVKFYTEAGNLDIVGFTMPVLFTRDPMLFPSIAHCFKKNPVTNLQDSNQVWDMVTSRPEIYASLFWLFSDYGTPDGLRHRHGYGVNTHKLVNKRGQYFYAKFHFRTKQGIKNLNAKRARELAGEDPDYLTRDLYNAIYRKEYPAWKFCIQVMTPEEAENLNFNVFDPTKENLSNNIIAEMFIMLDVLQSWSETKYPLIEVGELVLTQNPTNYFTDIEQLAFYPGSLIPGIEASLDRALQGRMIVYSDAQRYRLGVNYQQLPINQPINGFDNYDRDGKMAYTNQGCTPNYYPNSFHGPEPSPDGTLSKCCVNGTIGRYDLGDEDNYSEPRKFYNSLTENEKESFISNICPVLQSPPLYKFIQEKAIKQLKEIDADLGARIENELSPSFKRIHIIN